MDCRHANYVEIYERSEINFTTELSTPSPIPTNVLSIIMIDKAKPTIVYALALP